MIGELLTQVDQPALEGGGGGLGSVGHAELAENVIDVTLDGRFADAQAGADFFIALASHDQLEHFHLSAGQIRAGHSLGQAARRWRRECAAIRRVPI